MMNRPLVSVVIPTYNSVCYLTEAIDSVLAQTFQDFEILVVDDGSTDETATILEEKYKDRIRYLHKANGGVSSARNFGIQRAQGKYIAFLDADDIWMPEKLATQIEALAKDEKSKVCYSSLLICDEDLNYVGLNLSPRRDDIISDLLLIGNVVATPSSVIAEMELFHEVGAFDVGLSQCADWEMWIRLSTKTGFIYIDQPLVKYRQHGSNMSRNAALLEKDSIRVLQKSFNHLNLPYALKNQETSASAKNYMVLAGTYFHAGAYRQFLRCSFCAIRLDVKQFFYLLGFPARRLK